MDDPVRILVAKDEILDVMNSLFIYTDRRDWTAVRDCFAPTVLFDMSSSGGGRPAERPVDAIVAGWEEGLRGVEQIHHQAGNYRVQVNGDTAEAFCYGTATHFRRTASGRNVRTFVGSYDFGLERIAERWRIRRFRFVLKYMDGNLELERDG